MGKKFLITSTDENEVTLSDIISQTYDSNSSDAMSGKALANVVNNILEYDNKESFPITGFTEKIYVDKEKNTLWRWTGTEYSEVSSLELGETASTAYAGDKGKTLADKLSGIAEGAEVNVQSDWNEANESSDAFIKNKPFIPSEVTETTVSNWGFTKNEGTYIKPNEGIPSSDLSESVQSSLSKAETALQSFTESDPIFTQSSAYNITDENITAWNNKSDFSGDYNDLDNKPSIPAEVTESIVAEWGFTKNKGEYNKPETGIPSTDLSSDVQEKLEKAETALQSFTEQDPTVPSHVKSISEINISNWNAKAEISDIPNVPSWALEENKPNYSANEVGAIASTEKGSNDGVATLGSDGKVPAAQLPSYVDDVEEYYGKEFFPGTGESGKIYIDIETNITYRWGGTEYVPIGSDLALGETSSTAYAGDKGKANANAISELQTKINSLPTSYAPINAQENIIEIVKINNEALTPTSKTINIAIPTSAADINALPDNTFIPTISDTYSATSTDGMSGKAVAAAIQNFGTYSKPEGGIPATDLTDAVQASLSKADSALQSYTETDPVFTVSAAHGITSDDITNWNAKADADDIPDVPSWALESEKPTYTADEVGALPDTTTIPTKTSQLTNDSNFAKISDDSGSYTSGDNVLYTSNIVNNLTSTSTTDALSAAQGKALSDKIKSAVGVTIGETAGTAYEGNKGKAVTDLVGNTALATTNKTVTGAINELKTNFQAGVDGIYDAIVAQGTTPASKSQSDVQAGIGTMATAKYNDGKNDALAGLTTKAATTTTPSITSWDASTTTTTLFLSGSKVNFTGDYKIKQLLVHNNDYSAYEEIRDISGSVNVCSADITLQPQNHAFFVVEAIHIEESDMSRPMTSISATSNNSNVSCYKEISNTFSPGSFAIYRLENGTNTAQTARITVNLSGRSSDVYVFCKYFCREFKF